MRRNLCLRLAAAIVLMALPACTIQWRQQQIEPLDTDRRYDAEYEPAWEAVRAVLEDMELEVEEARQSDGVGVVGTDFKVLSDTGDPINRLNRVAYTGPGGFIGGRYAVTVTVREQRSGGIRVKVNTRIEGYINEEFGYQTLRSRGLIEEEVFARIGQRLGTEPIA